MSVGSAILSYRKTGSDRLRTDTRTNEKTRGAVFCYSFVYTLAFDCSCLALDADLSILCTSRRKKLALQHPIFIVRLQ